MTTPPAGSLLVFLEQVPDPRGLKGRRHALSAMLATVVAAVLCGCRGYKAIAQWIHLQEVTTWHAFGYLRKPPTRNAFRGLLLTVDPDELEAALWRWVVEGLGLPLSEDDLQAVVIDGKTLRGTVSQHRRSVHVLALLDLATGGILGQSPVHEETNEAKAAPGSREGGNSCEGWCSKDASWSATRPSASGTSAERSSTPAATTW